MFENCLIKKGRAKPGHVDIASTMESVKLFIYLSYMVVVSFL